MLQLSEIKGEKSMDILAEIIGPVTNIATDKKAAELFGRKPLPEDMTITEYVMTRIRAAFPALIKTHKKDLVKILSTLNEMSEAEYKKQLTMESMIVDMTTLITDPIFNAFFITPQSIEISSGSASENTEE